VKKASDKQFAAAPVAAAREPRSASAWSRRRFVALVAAGSAALIAQPGAAAERPRRRRTPSPKPAPHPPELSKLEREMARQRAGTLATLKQLRDYPLPPGGDLPVVFRPQRTPSRGR
jgi:hypothetical protein